MQTRQARSLGTWHRAEDVVPIPGTRRRSYLEEKVAAPRRDPAVCPP